MTLTLGGSVVGRVLRPEPNLGSDGLLTEYPGTNVGGMATQGTGLCKPVIRTGGVLPKFFF